MRLSHKHLVHLLREGHVDLYHIKIDARELREAAAELIELAETIEKMKEGNQ